MRIIGIDPGYAIVGYGVLDLDKSRFSVVNYGAITTNAGTKLRPAADGDIQRHVYGP